MQKNASPPGTGRQGPETAKPAGHGRGHASWLVPLVLATGVYLALVASSFSNTTS